MSYDTLAAPTPFTVDIASELGVFAEAMDWNTANWSALVTYLEDHMDTTGKLLGQMTVDELQSAIWATGPRGPHVSHVKCLIGEADTSPHDLFCVTRKLLRIYDLRMIELLKLFELLERCPGKVENLTVKNLLALIAIVDFDDIPIFALPKE